MDDEHAIANALQRELEADHEVLVATSGAQALELLLGDAVFDVILCDVLMPGITGMDLHRELRGQRPELLERLIFMSGGEGTPMVRDFLARVRNARVDKPFDLPRLRALIRVVARAKRASPEERGRR